METIINRNESYKQEKPKFSKQESKILEVIAEMQEKNYPVTINTLSDFAGISKNVASRLLHDLRVKSAIKIVGSHQGKFGKKNTAYKINDTDEINPLKISKKDKLIKKLREQIHEQRIIIENLQKRLERI